MATKQVIKRLKTLSVNFAIVLFARSNLSVPYHYLSLLREVEVYSVTLNTFVWILALGFLFVFRGRVLVCSPSWPVTHSDRPGWPQSLAASAFPCGGIMGERGWFRLVFKTVLQCSPG